jgi:hypothetical protein
VTLVPQDSSQSRTCDILVPNHDTIDIVLEHVAEALGNTVGLVNLVSNVYTHITGLDEALVASEDLLLYVGAESLYDTSSGRPLTIAR